MFKELTSRHLFTMRMKSERQTLGTTQYGDRWITLVTAAEIEGPTIRAKLLPGASDWITSTPDGVIRLDCRMTFETDDGATIAMTYRGMRHGPAELLDRVMKGEEVDPELIYHRVAIFFETEASAYLHLNKLIAIGKAKREPDGGVYGSYSRSSNERAACGMPPHQNLTATL